MEARQIGHIKSEKMTQKASASLIAEIEHELEDVLLDTRNNKGEDDIEGTGGAETYEELLEDMDYMEASDENDDDVLSYESDDNDA